ncbi:hypothetical protein FQR65_LT11263 [Abscondita terminalis]|nr:hypothetical protein FQR65_LT11263 [Abscondita terminalis]
MNKKNLTDADANAMGRKLIFAIAADNFTEFEALIKKGANVNFRDENTGNTLLHFLYYYAQCAVKYLELLLENTAKISTNKEGLLPIAMAKEKCNGTEFQKIKDIFERYNTPSKLNKTGIIPYSHPQQDLAITIGMPITAFFEGVFVGGLKEVAQRNKDRYPFLPNFIFFGLQPISLAIVNAVMDSLLLGNAVSVSIEDEWLSFAFYLVTNYWSLLIAQSLEICAEKIQNKVFNLLIPILFYTIYLNPSVLFKFLSEVFVGKGLQTVMLPLLSTLSSGTLFKAGKYATQKQWWPADGPFEVMLGAILTQNTHWSNVEKALLLLKQQVPLTAEAILSLSRTDLEICLKPSAQGAYASLDALSTWELRDQLLKVQGIGPETADDILLYAFNRPVFVIDAYTRRLLQRLGLIQEDGFFGTLKRGMSKKSSKKKNKETAVSENLIRFATLKDPYFISNNSIKNSKQDNLEENSTTNTLQHIDGSSDPDYISIGLTHSLNGENSSSNEQLKANNKKNGVLEVTKDTDVKSATTKPLSNKEIINKIILSDFGDAIKLAITNPYVLDNSEEELIYKVFETMVRHYAPDKTDKEILKLFKDFKNSLENPYQNIHAKYQNFPGFFSPETKGTEENQSESTSSENKNSDPENIYMIMTGSGQKDLEHTHTHANQSEQILKI